MGRAHNMRHNVPFPVLRLSNVSIRNIPSRKHSILQRSPGMGGQRGQMQKHRRGPPSDDIHNMPILRDLFLGSPYTVPNKTNMAGMRGRRGESEDGELPNLWVLL